MNKFIKNSIKIILGLLILVILLHYLDLKHILSIMIQFKLIFLPILIIMFIVSLVIGGLNIYVLLLALKENVKFSKVVLHYITSWTYGLIIPGKIGEFSIIYFLKKEGVSVGKGTLIAILSKLISFVCFFVIALFGIFSFFSLKDAIIILSIISVVFITFLILLITDKGRNSIKKLFLRKYSKLFAGFSKNMQYLVRKGKIAVLISVILTFSRLVTMSLFVWLTFMAFGAFIPFYQILIVTSTTIIVSLIPISVGGLGVRESTAVVLFLNYGVGTSLSAAVFFFYAIIRYTLASLFIIYNIIIK